MKLKKMLYLKVRNAKLSKFVLIVAAEAQVLHQHHNNIRTVQTICNLSGCPLEISIK